MLGRAAGEDVSRRAGGKRGNALDHRRRDSKRRLKQRLRLDAPAASADEDGEALSTSVKRGWIETGKKRWEMVDGRSEILKTSELARTLVLFRGEEELLRAPLQLTPGELTVLRL